MDVMPGLKGLSSYLGMDIRMDVCDLSWISMTISMSAWIILHGYPLLHEYTCGYSYERSTDRSTCVQR